ncbi:ROK family protein [Paenibacillaceae bacterium WGS1546]|uniref:ROK family protein n=1 Tax=Cohnella sp. WGS1546 TaxID=3366810 RepID=UPI00372D1786
MKIGAIEAGGTKFVCGIGDEQGRIEERISFPTETPEKTMHRVITFFGEKRLEAIGIGTFGPINLNHRHPEYGHMTTTPKPGWSNYPFLSTLRERFDIPIALDTDVNAAAFGEASWGAAKGLDNCLYVTIGTGIGVGVFSGGKLVHGLVHPEGGHIRVRRHEDDSFEGICPYHGDCLEGLASGPALEKRWRMKGSKLEAGHKAWEIEAYYIAQALTSAILLLSPEKIILGGGVMQQRQLFPLIRAEVRKQLNGYVAVSALNDDIDTYIVPPDLGDNAGLAGALALGIRALLLELYG